MLRTFEKLGLKRSLFLVLALVLAAAAVAVTAALEGMLRADLLAALEQTARAQARLAALQAGEALADGSSAAARREAEARLGAILQEGDQAYLVVTRADREVVARAVRADWAGPLEAALAEHRRHAGEGFFEGSGLHLLSLPIHSGTGPATAWVLVGQPTAALESRLARLRTTLLLALGVSGLVLLGALWLVGQRLLGARLGELGRLAGRIAEADLTGRAAPGADEELGVLAGALNRTAERLAETVNRTAGVSAALARVVERAGRSGASVARGTDTVAARVAETGAAMGEMLQRLRGVALHVEVLGRSAGESSASLAAMAATNQTVAESTRHLASSVQETTGAIQQMTSSIQGVAAKVEELSTTAEETSASMNQMDGSIGQVESNANETARLSEQAWRDAEQGAEAISRTLAGIERIKGSSREAAAVIEQLGQKIGTIGNILNVIDDVAEQTNLLALNAAILAAQSGEHGKGFAVVADEIKDLAERTGASTKEISELIRSVQAESQNAVVAMERGVKNVDEGVRLGQEAETALKKIQSSSQKSTQMVKAIARATVEQAKGSRAATRSIGRIVQTVQEIAAAVSAQADNGGQITRSAEQMKIATRQVERSSQEQAQGVRLVSRSMASMGDLAGQLGRAQREQTQGSEVVVAAVRQIKEVAEAQAGAVRDLGEAIAELSRQAEVLAGEVRRFKV